MAGYFAFMTECKESSEAVRFEYSLGIIAHHLRGNRSKTSKTSATARPIEAGNDCTCKKPML